MWLSRGVVWLGVVCLGVYQGLDVWQTALLIECGAQEAAPAASAILSCGGWWLLACAKALPVGLLVTALLAARRRGQR